jgi:hypothetical protein
MLLLYVGYIGLAIYVYWLIRGSLWAYAGVSLLTGVVLWGAFRFYFRRS